MVDVATNRMFDAFNRFTPNDNQQDSLSTITRLKRFSNDQRYKRIINRQAEIKVSYIINKCKKDFSYCNKNKKLNNFRLRFSFIRLTGST